MSVVASCRRWLGLKIYQFEVTFAVYMFTPWEKFAFCTPLSDYFTFSCPGKHVKGGKKAAVLTPGGNQTRFSSCSSA